MRMKFLSDERVYEHILYFRHVLLRVMNLYYNRVYGMSIHKTSRISLKAKLDKTNPKGVIIGSYSYVAFGAVILTHDFLNNIHCNTVIGDKCFIGCNAIILPGVTIGNEVVVAAGAVVKRNIESNCLVAGNPAKIIRKINTKNYGQFIK